VLTLPLLALALAAAPIADDESFQTALALYEDLEFEQAILRLQSIAIRKGIEPQDQATVLVWLGVTYGQTGDLTAARENFGLAFMQDINIQLPVRVSPDLNKIFRDEHTLAESRAAAATEEPANPTPEPDPAPAVVDPEPAPAEETGGMAGLYWGIGGTALAGGLVATAAGVGLGAWSYLSITEAADPAVTQKAASDLVDTANMALIGAAVSGTLGVVLLGAGGAGIGLALME